MAACVAGVRRTMKELVDGTIRVSIDIDPKYRDDFLRLFSAVDMPVALAPLNPKFEHTGDEMDPVNPALGEPITQIATFLVNDAESKELGGSTWAQLGGLTQSSIMLCKDERFQKWVLSQHPENKDHPPEETATDYIRQRCGVESRKHLDASIDSRTKFGQMMAGYRTWLSAAT